MLAHGLSSFIVSNYSLLAHGIGVRSDLPLPFWLFVNSAVAALVISFLLLGFLWKRPLLSKAAAGYGLPGSFLDSLGTHLAKTVAVVLRVVGLVLFAVVLYAALASPLGSGASIAPVAVFVVFWVGLQLLSGVLGNIWRFLSPWETLAMAGSWVKQKFFTRPDRSLNLSPDRSLNLWQKLSGWLGVSAVAAFLWLELAHPDPADTRMLGWGILGYTIIVLLGAGLAGRQWLTNSEGFGMLFGKIAAMGFVYRDENARVRFRTPLAGLSRLKMTPAGTSLVLLVLGSTTFDGLSGTRWWGDLLRSKTGWGRVPFSTLGLVGCVLAVSLGYLLAIAVAVKLSKGVPSSELKNAQFAAAGRSWATSQSTAASRSWATPHSAATGSFISQTLHLAVKLSHSLVPLLLAYSIAHYFSLLVFEGQDFVALLSDPFGNGWDLFGTADFTINFRLISTQTIAWVQSIAIVLGHIGGVIVAHDRALELFPPSEAAKSQIPLLMVMIGYTLVGLLLLLNA